MSDFLSTTFRALRYCVASLGCLFACAFIAYGALLKLDGNAGVENDLILGFGVFVAVMSSCIGALSRTGDLQVQRLIDANNAQLGRLNASNQQLEQRVNSLVVIEQRLAENTRRFEEQLLAAEERYKARLKSLREENQRLGHTVDNLSVERRKFEEENAGLALTKDSFEHTLAAYKQQLEQVQDSHRASAEELVHLRLLSAENDVRVEQLNRMNVSQAEKIGEMTKQLENLNELQRKSTRMIQMLALYGDECKTLGSSLKDTAETLHKTDHSLGLTAGEMSAQVKALQTITDQLKQVALSRGIDEDDPDDYVSMDSSDSV